MQQQKRHKPVLLEQVIAQLNIKPDGIYIDATFGRGGHSAAILRCLGQDGRLIVMDKDPEAIACANVQLGSDSRVFICQGSFRNLQSIIKTKQLEGKVSGLLLDLGVSSPQLEEPERGFSFLQNGPLDMRMDPNSTPSAAEWLASATEKEMVRVLRELGEERYARRIVRSIIVARQQAPITTTLQLATIVKLAHPRWERHRHPATKTFQALRMLVNQELDDLSTCLTASLSVLMIGGRLLVISFHSLEDRLVKRFMRQFAHEPTELKYLPQASSAWKATLKILGRAIKPDAQAIAENLRCRSARLRVAEKLL